MSLDVYLIGEKVTTECRCRDCGNVHEVTEDAILFDSNITHNLGDMASEAGIYEALWRPSDIGATKAKDIIELLEKGLAILESRPNHFKKFNSPNGWGMYENFVPFVKEYLEACKTYPEAKI